MRNPVEMARTIYPRLADIPGEETLSAITTLETQEREFIDTAPEGNGVLRARPVFARRVATLGSTQNRD